MVDRNADSTTAQVTARVAGEARPEACDDTRTQLRSALRRLAKAVVVVTCNHGNARFAMAATAVSELSMDPPSLLVCVNRTASIFEPLTRARYFGISILHSSQRAISERCSGAVKGEARFGVGNWAENHLGVPYIRDAQACIFCRQDHRIDYGTHGVFLARVLEARSNGTVSPLVYVNGRYTNVADCS